MRLAHQFQGQTVMVTDGGGIPCRPNPAATLLVLFSLQVCDGE